MRKIVEYPCVIGEGFNLDIPPASLLGVFVGDTGPVLFADVDDAGATTERSFIFKKSDEEIPAGAVYVDSCRDVDPSPPNMVIAFHLFELV